MVDGRLCFTANDGRARALWLLDPSADSVIPIGVGTATEGHRSNPDGLTAPDDTLYSLRTTASTVPSSGLTTRSRAPFR